MTMSMKKICQSAKKAKTNKLNLGMPTSAAVAVSTGSDLSIQNSSSSTDLMSLTHPFSTVDHVDVPSLKSHPLLRVCDEPSFLPSKALRATLFPRRDSVDPTSPS